MTGLSSSEAAKRREQGLSNRVDQKTSRSFADIFIANFLNIANVILLAIVLVLLGLGKVPEALGTGGVVVVNIIIGTFQEFRAKRQLDRIALLTRPQVTVLRDGNPLSVDQADVVQGDAVLFQAGDQAVVDGRMVGGRVEVDESLLTGESDLIPKREGDEILSGSFAVVGEGVFIAEKVGAASFAHKLTSGARAYTRQVTPLQYQISVIVRVLVVVALALSGLLCLAYIYQRKPFGDAVEDIAVVVSLIPQGLLLMITVAYALGAVRIARKGALVQQINAVESLSNVDVLCMDKTGTLTTNRILFHALHPLDENTALAQILGDYIASTGAKNRTAEAIAHAIPGNAQTPVLEVPFSSARKWAGASFVGGNLAGTYILGAPEVLLPDAESIQAQSGALAREGLRVLLLVHTPEPWQSEPEALPPSLSPLGLVSFADELRPRVGEVLAGFRRANITLKLISGDNPATVAALAYQAGFSPEDDRAISGMALDGLSAGAFAEAVRQHAIFGRITPEQKQAIVEVLRGDGRYVAMVGDGVNDVLSLKKAQVGIAMQDGSAAARSVADMVLLGNRFEVLPDAFLEGQRILNGMSDSTRLFLTRTLYAALLIVITGYIGSEFPYTPLHNTLLTSLPVGIPAFFLAYWAKAGQPQKSLLVSTTEFVLPAGVSLMLVNMFLWIWYLSYHAASLELARTVVTSASLLGGLWVIIIAEGAGKKTDPRRVGLALVMLVLFGLVLGVPALRRAFQLVPLAAADLALIGAVLVVWAAALGILQRYRLLERLLIPIRPD